MLYFYQDDGEKDDDFSHDSEEGPESRVLVLDPDEGDALGTTLRLVARVRHVVGNTLEAPAVGPGSKFNEIEKKNKNIYDKFY